MNDLYRSQHDRSVDAGEDPSHKINILLVDDSPESLVALESLLTGPDRNLIKVGSGQEALRYLLAHDVGLILLDVKMSGLSGYETAGLIRKRERTRNVPIIFLTAYSKDDADVVRGYSYGAAGYMFKPIAPVVLQSQVNCFVELAKKAEELKTQKNELERAEAELMGTRTAATLIKCAPLPAFIANAAGVVLQVNDGAAELLTLQAGMLLEASAAHCLDGEEAWRLTAALREVAERGVLRDVSIRARQKDGDVRPITVLMSPLRDDADRVIGVLGFLRDMQQHERVVAELESTKHELTAKAQDLETFKDIVLTRMVEAQRLEQENRRLQEALTRLQEQSR